MLFKQNPIVRQWTELNAPFASNSNRGPKEGPRWIMDWQGPLAVSAVHAVDHVRDGRWKNTDAGTGGLAMTLSNIAGCSKVAVTRSVPMMGDANWDVYHPLKAQIEGMGVVDERTVYIDLHGMKDGHGRRRDHRVRQWFAVVAWRSGSGSRRTSRATRSRPIRMAAGAGFGATKPGTMTSWAQSLGATAIQIEISRSHRAGERRQAERASRHRPGRRPPGRAAPPLDHDLRRVLPGGLKPPGPNFVAPKSLGDPATTKLRSGAGKLSPWRPGNRPRGRR